MNLNQSSLQPRIILILLILLSQTPELTAQLQFGNSYVNVSKKKAGGTVQPGDTLEIRTNYYFPTGLNSNNIYSLRYLDNVPTNTAYVADSMKLITNEGLLYKKWTDAAGDDPGTYQATPPAGQYNIRINVGNNATAPANNGTTDLTGASTWVTGPANSTTKPRIGGGSLLTTSFLVRVTGNVGDTITLGAGRLMYRTSSNGGSDVTVATTQYKILISNNDPICADAVGRNFVAEAGGTFDSGTVQNRSYGPAYFISGYQYKPLAYPGADQTGDGTYTIVNNLSPSGSTYQNALKQPNCGTAVSPPLPIGACENRMFRGHWDIIGDHTGSTTPAGNPPAAPGTRGGYMLVVNAAYYTSEAYRQFISGLCPNTSYEFSLWVRNVCTNCGVDSNRNQTWAPGVRPNLTFAVNGLDRYSSGEIDTIGWIKKGFTFKTASNQTSILISIRNNASGGGGNDWAIDDIALVTCNPNLSMNPGPTAPACLGQQVNVSAIVRSYFNNYVNYEWERSTDGGNTWNSTGVSGTGTPVLTNGLYQYEAPFPSFLGDSASHGRRYRIKVASSTTNLADVNCSFNANTTVVVLINNCQWILSTRLLTFTGQLQNNYTALRWTTENEDASTTFEVERSNDGTHFTKIGTLSSRAAGSGATYSFNDPTAVTGTAYYRLKTHENGNYSYSRIVMVSNKLEFNIHSLANPFTSQIEFNVVSPEKGIAYITITDSYGRIVKQSRENMTSGLNNVKLSGLEILSQGAYTLRVQMKDKIINKQVIKMKRQ
ncbi:MAG: T9SS type A sorting domain-containing protein [Niastella sp.]|nr:T9SS type A sorting domain-containing protein [Niastella sp.]